jgi:hypothetical protein
MKKYSPRIFLLPCSRACEWPDFSDCGAPQQKHLELPPILCEVMEFRSDHRAHSRVILASFSLLSRTGASDLRNRDERVRA